MGLLGSGKKVSNILEYAVAGGVGAAVALAAAPAAIGAMGFGAGGITGASTAAGMMSVLGGAATPAGGVVANCQTVGALSTPFVSGPAVLAIAGGGALVGGVGYCAYKIYKQKGGIADGQVAATSLGVAGAMTNRQAIGALSNAFLGVPAVLAAYGGRALIKKA